MECGKDCYGSRKGGLGMASQMTMLSEIKSKTLREGTFQQRKWRAQTPWVGLTALDMCEGSASL